MFQLYLNISKRVANRYNIASCPRLRGLQIGRRRNTVSKLSNENCREYTEPVERGGSARKMYNSNVTRSMTFLQLSILRQFVRACDKSRTASFDRDETVHQTQNVIGSPRPANLRAGLFSEIHIPQPVGKYGLLLPQKQMQPPQKAIYFPQELNKVFRYVITRTRGSLLKCFEGNETNFLQRYFKAYSFFLVYPPIFLYRFFRQFGK